MTTVAAATFLPVVRFRRLWQLGISLLLRLLLRLHQKLTVTISGYD
jgi:hypothetical protein